MKKGPDYEKLLNGWTDPNFRNLEPKSWKKNLWKKNPHFCQSIQLPGTDHQEGDIKKVFFVKNFDQIEQKDTSQI